jgi:hypothetical protein
MAYITFAHDRNYGPRKGLEGPFHYANGRVLYYCPKEGAYWDPKTDFFVDSDELAMLHGMTLDALRNSDK